jgi:hypothetical protein
MISHKPAIDQMKFLLSGWEVASDQRRVFLGCYTQMTANMLTDIQAGGFHDNDWVRQMLEHFAEYYFEALEVYQRQPESAPAIWRLTFEAAADPQTHVLQHLMLGINAHINYDLVFALEDVLRPEWATLSPSQRTERYEDHCRVNQVIARTVDAVQDTVVERFSPEMDRFDDGMGRLDEWLASRMISHYRDQVWQRAVERLEAQDELERQAIHNQVERSCLERARLIREWSVGNAIRGLINDL